MSSKLFPFLVCTLISYSCFPQSCPSNCEATACEQSTAIVKYIQQAKFDSAEISIYTWETICGSSEPMIRAKILVACAAGDFNESLYANMRTQIMEYLYDYEQRSAYAQCHAEYYEYGKPSWGYISFAGPFDRFLRQFADSLASRQQENSLAYLFCRFYAGDATYFYTQIQKPEYDQTIISEEYTAYTHEFTKDYLFKFALVLGYFMPYHNLDVLGESPQAGLQVHFNTGNNYRISFSFISNTNSSANYYDVLFQDSLYHTREASHFLVDISAEKGILQNMNNRFYLSAGAGYASIESVSIEGSEDASDYKYIESPALNAGAGYTYKISPGMNIGLLAKYNFVFYHNAGGTDLSGNYLTLQLIFGFLQNSYASERLDAVQYDNFY